MTKLLLALLASTALALTPAAYAQTAADATSTTTPPGFAKSGDVAVRLFGGVPGLAYLDGKTWRSVPVGPVNLGAPPQAVSLMTAAFGAVPDANTPAAAAANVAALAKAFQTSNDVYCPSGRTFYVNATLAVPAAATSLWRCKFVAAASAATNLDSVLYIPNTTGFVGHDVEADADIKAFPTTVGIRSASNTNVTLENTVTKAAYGIVDNASVGVNIVNAKVPDFGIRGIWLLNTTFGTVTNSNVKTSTLLSGHCFAFENGGNHTATNNYAQGCGGFGLSFAGTGGNMMQRVVASSNYVKGSRIEGINFQDVLDYTVTGNVLEFDANSTDFGMSNYGTDTSGAYDGFGELSGNVVMNACKASLARASDVRNVSDHGNTFVNGGACVGRQASFTGSISTAGVLTVTAVASGAIGMINDVLTGSGIPTGTTVAIYSTSGTTGSGGTGTYQLLGPNGADLSLGTAIASESITSAFGDAAHSTMANLIYGNAVSNGLGTDQIIDNSSRLTAAYAEVVDPTGTPNNNQLGTAQGYRPLYNTVLGAQSTSTGWLSYAPAFTCDSGGPPTMSGVGGAYQKLGQTVSMNARGTLSALNGCSGILHLNLPIATATGVQTSIFGRENAATGKALQLITGGAAVTGSFLYFDNSNPLAAGINITINGTYQSQ